MRGISTAHSASPIKEKISPGNDSYVWQSPNGNSRGQAIEPLYKTIPEVVINDLPFYELIVITDTIRIGKSREIQIAIEELTKRI